MKIKILGTRGEIYPSALYHSHHSGMLLDGKLLFDLGEKEFLEYKPSIIFITHLHPDHAYFVLNKYKKWNINIPIYAPENYKNKLHVISHKKTFGKYKITPIPTVHSKKVKSQAYIIENAKQKILYTGDLIWIDKKYHSKLSNLDLVITEGSFFRKGGQVRRDKETGQIYGHTGIPDLVHLFKNFTKNILLEHFGSWFYKDIKKSRKKLKKLGTENNINLIVGYDGLTIDINKLKK